MSNDDKSLWQRFTSALPWNQSAAKAKERDELEQAILAMDTEPAPPAGSAAEAMAAMKQESRAKRTATAPPAADEPSETPNPSALRDKWQATARGGPSEADKDDLKRNRGA